MEAITSTYRNPWHQSNNSIYGPKFFTTLVKPTEYRGYLIYETVAGKGWDVVKNDICITQRAGLNGAKRFIDQLEDPNNTCWFKMKSLSYLKEFTS